MSLKTHYSPNQRTDLGFIMTEPAYCAMRLKQGSPLAYWWTQEPETPLLTALARYVRDNAKGPSRSPSLSARELSTSGLGRRRLRSVGIASHKLRRNKLGVVLDKPGCQIVGSLTIRLRLGPKLQIL